MAEYLIQKETLTSIANAIREKTGDTGTMKPAEFPDKIRAIKTGSSAKLVPLVVTENGTHTPSAVLTYGRPFTFKNSFTQEELAALFAKNYQNEGVGYVNEDDTILVILSVINEEDGTVIAYYTVVANEDGSEIAWIPDVLAPAFEITTGEGWYIYGEDIPILTDAPTFTFSEGGMCYGDLVLSDFSILFADLSFDGYSSVEVNVQPTLETLTVTENGNYTVPEGIDGYNAITVSVPTEGDGDIPEGYLKPEGTIKIAENGTVDVGAFAYAKVDVPTGGGTETVLTALSVTENGTYAPKNAFNPFSDTPIHYRFKASYTQDFLAPLYAEAAAVYEIQMNDFATGAYLIDNNDEDSNAIAIIRFTFGENLYYYGLMKACTEPKFWMPAEVASALGQSTEGWYSVVDANTMSFTPSSVPDYPIINSATYVLDTWESIAKLFVYDEFDGYSSVEVNVQPTLETEEVSIDPDFSSGDMVVQPTEDKLISSVTVKKPINLASYNIVQGVDIAGIVGTYAGSGGGGDFDTSDRNLHYFVYKIDGEDKEIRLYYATDEIIGGGDNYEIPDTIGGYNVIIKA